MSHGGLDPRLSADSGRKLDEGENSLTGRLQRSLLCALALALLLLGASSSSADTPTQAIIDNGTIQLGINPEGHLNVEGGAVSRGGCSIAEPCGTSAVGLRFLPQLTESTAPGCLCEGWGAADAASGVSGYANVSSDGGAHNLRVVSFQVTETTAVSIVDVLNADGVAVMQVKQDYHPSPKTPNLYEDTVTIENVSESTLADVRYRRVMDWDIEPTAFSEWVTIDGSPAERLLADSNDGFSSADPLSPIWQGGVSHRYEGFFTDAGNGVDENGDGKDDFPDDHGANFDFGFGALEPGAQTSFNIYYGAAPSENDALNAVAAVGAEVWSLGESSCPTEACPDDNGRDLGTPNTFVFGFGSVGGDPFAGGDRRPPLYLNVFAPAEVGPGDPNPFEVRSSVKNVGDGTATGVTTRIVLGEGLALAAGETSGQDVGTLEPGVSADRSWHVTAPESCVDQTYSFDVYADYAGRDPSEEVRHVHKDVLVKASVQCRPDLELTKTGDPQTVARGQQVTYLLTVRNVGTAEDGDVTLLDTLPEGMSFVDATPSVGTCEQGSPVSCAIGTMRPGDSATVILRATAGATGTFTNTARVFGEIPESSDENNDASATTTVVEPTPDATLAVDDAAVLEGDSDTVDDVFTVRLSEPSDLPVTVRYATADNTAGAPGDYTGASGTIAFAPGQVVKTVAVTVNGDRTTEPDETFVLRLSGADGAAIADAEAVGTVVNDDALPSLSVADIAFDEGNSGVTNAAFTILFDRPTSSTVVLDYATASGTAASGLDFQAASGTLRIAPGATSAQLTVPVTGDTDYEANELFTLTLSSPLGATLGRAAATATIQNDDELADLSVTKVADPAAGLVGSPLRYTLVVRNDGPTRAQNVVAVDTLPANTTFVSTTAPCALDPADPARRTVRCVLGVVNNGDQVSVDVLVTPTASGSAVNVVTLSSTSRDPDASDLTFTLTTPVSNRATVPPPLGSSCSLLGTNGNDTITGRQHRDRICGLHGNDVLRGRGGDDDIDGGWGADTIYAGRGADKVTGGRGKDVIYANEKSDRPDTIAGGPGYDVAYVNANDTVTGVEEIHRA